MPISTMPDKYEDLRESARLNNYLSIYRKDILDLLAERDQLAQAIRAVQRENENLRSALAAWTISHGGYVDPGLTWETTSTASGEIVYRKVPDPDYKEKVSNATRRS